MSRQRTGQDVFEMDDEEAQEGELLELSTFSAANADPLAFTSLYFNVVSEFPEPIGVPSDEAILAKLRNKCAPQDQALWSASADQKIAALASFTKGFLAREEHRYFATALTAAVAECFKSRSPDHPRHRRLLYDMSKVMNGSALSPARENYDSPAGRSFVLKGVAKSGRTAFLQRIRAMFGPPYRVEPHASNAPGHVWYFPTLYVNWPDKNTVQALVEHIRNIFVSELRDPASDNDSRNFLLSLEGPKAVSATVAACVLFNVGLFILDGAVAAHIGGEFEGILAFAVELRRHGVPVLLSCSEAFLRRAGFCNPNIVAAFDGQIVTFPPLPAPKPAPPPPPPRAKATDASNARRQSSLWENYCLFFWEQGFFGNKLIEMPPELPAWAYKLCWGRLGWLAEGFHALHKHFVRKPHTLTNVNEDLVKAVFEEQLFVYQDARNAIGTSATEKPLEPATFLSFMDYLPGSAADQMNLTSYLSVAGRRSARR